MGVQSSRVHLADIHHRLFTLGTDARNETFTLRVSDW